MVSYVNLNNHPHASNLVFLLLAKFCQISTRKKYDFLTLYKGFSMENLIQISQIFKVKF